MASLGLNELNQQAHKGCIVNVMPECFNNEIYRVIDMSQSKHQSIDNALAEG